MTSVPYNVTVFLTGEEFSLCQSLLKSALTYTPATELVSLLGAENTDICGKFSIPFPSVCPAAIALTKAAETAA